MKKLPTLIDYVLVNQKLGGMEVQSIRHQFSDRARRFYEIVKFAEFLSQPLTLEMFIPCKDGKPLEKPDRDMYKDIDGIYDEYHWKINNEEYQKAEQEVLFKGFEVLEEEFMKGRNWIYINSVNSYGLVIFFKNKLYKAGGAQSIADLCEKVELTDNGIKQAGL